MDKRYVWHPFTPMKQYVAGEPLIIEDGDGFELIDTRGNRYIDGSSSLWCNLHGHCVPEIDAAVRRQLGRVAHSTLLGFASVPSIELAERLVRIAPRGLTKVFYSDSGAAAVEIALKTAFQYWRNLGRTKRRRFIALREAYHGDTIGSVSVGGIDLFHRIFHPLLFKTTFVDTPNPYYHRISRRGRFGDPCSARSSANRSLHPCARSVLDDIDRILSRAPDEYCAVIVEPLIQAAAGMLTHPPGFLKGLRELTRKHDVLLIADEVATGFCRTGKLFACEHEGVCPDIMCLGKGLSGGYLPVAATLTTQRVFDAFLGEPHEHKTFYHGHTFTGNALGCAAAVASINLIFSSGLLRKLPAKVRQVRAGLRELADHPRVGDIRQCGMMVGIELVRDREKRKPFDPKLRVGAEVCLRARRRGIIVRPLGDVVVLMPAPAMDSRMLDRLLSGVTETIREYFREAPKF